MPIFEYRCPEGHVLECLQPRPDVAVLCPQCEQVGRRHVMEKIPSVARFGGFAEPKESLVSRAIRKVKERGL